MRQVSILFYLFLAGCVTSKVIKDPHEQAHSMIVYEGKIAVILPQKTHQLTFNFFSHPNGSTGRLELRAMLGISAATLWLNGSEFTLLNHIKKETYKGDRTQQGFQSWINVDIDPNVFFIAMNEKSFGGWNCVRSGNGELQQCSKDSTLVEFERVTPQRKRVAVKMNQAEVRFLIELPGEYKALDSKVFQPVSPRDYKIFTQP